jgi:hypothetical protein
LDIKIFHKKDGGIIQLVEIEKIKDWPIEMPFIFVEFIRSNKLRTYRDPEVEKKISQYLDKILNDIAIPNIQKILDDANTEEILSTFSVFEELSEMNNRAVLPIQQLLEKLTKNINKNIASQAQKILSNIK